MTAHASSPAAPLLVRRYLPPLDQRVPRHWCGGDPVLSHLLNTFTLLVPGNEGYYIRTLKRCLPRISDPALRATVVQFMRQEGQHGAGHHRGWRVLESQGYRIDGFNAGVDALLYRFLEPITPLKLRLSMVACVEHVNAYLGHEFLAQQILRDAHPELRGLFEWHFAEEIEHKHVAHDALHAVAPGYALRMLGAALVVPMFYALMTLGTVYLLWQDESLLKRGSWAAWRHHLFSGHQMLRRTCGHLLAYLRPDFHPWQVDDRALAQAAIERHASAETPMLHPSESAQESAPPATAGGVASRGSRRAA